MNLLHQLRALFEPVLAELAPDPAKLPDLLGMVKPAANAEHGDYQANFAMPLGKSLGKKPQEVAQQFIVKLPANDVIETPTVAGPGFINLRLKSEFLAKGVQQISADPKLGVEPAASSTRARLSPITAPRQWPMCKGPVGLAETYSTLTRSLPPMVEAP